LLDDPAPQQAIEAWPIPSLLPTAGTWIGALPADAVLPDGFPGLRDTGRTAPLAAVADAYLYLGRL
jgi:hypothetical protein